MCYDLVACISEHISAILHAGISASGKMTANSVCVA